MARRPRIEYPGAVYHVIARGNRQVNIFSDDQDRLKFLALLGDYKKRQSFLLHAYVLMSNHVHLLLETRKESLSLIMQRLNSTYTQYFNRRHREVGHLFQGRYKAILVDKDAYLATLVRYIHQNPVRAGMVASADKYFWSSHTAYLRSSDDLVDTSPVLSMFSDKPAEARRKFRKFVTESTGAEERDDLYSVTAGQILGDEAFVGKIETKHSRGPELLRKPSMDEVIRAVSIATRVEAGEWISRRRGAGLSLARGVFVLVCRAIGFRQTDAARTLGREASALTRWSYAAENEDGQRLLRKTLTCLK